MDGIPNLLRAGIESELKDKTFRNLLLSCADQRAFTKCSTGISSFIGLINGKLNEPSSRNDGLLLLQTFLPQCSLDVLTQNGSLWIQLCLKGAASRHTAQLSFIVLKMLLNLSESVPELSRHVSSVAVANFAEIIHNGISPQAYIDALDCLELCMKKYNGPCGPHKKVIHSFLFSLLDYSGPNQLQVVWQAARCVALVPQVGGGGTGGVQYKLAWASQQKQLCRTIHLILDDLYSDTNELQVSLMGGMLEGTEPLPLPEIDDSNPVLRTQNLVSRLFAVSACLQAMLVMAYPVAKNVSLSSIMNLICRGLAVNGSSIGPSNTTHTLALTAVLPKVHQSLLKLLEALIVLARANLLPFAASICRLSMQTLKWTRVENWPYGTERPYKLLRIQAYENLRIWCGIVKGGSGIEDTAHQFIDVALHDIFSEKDTVSLSAGLLKKSNNQRKAKGHKGAASLAAAAMAKDGLVVNEVANKDVCVAALKAATAILMAASSRMQASVHQALQETVVAVLLKVSFKAGESPIPYSNPSARLELYRLLLQLVLNGHTVWPTPINMALKFFSSGLHDPDVEISMFCGIAQSTLEKIIHPAYPSLYITPSQKEVDACIETSAEAVMSELPIIRVEDHSGEADHDPNEAGTPSKSCPQRSFAVPRSVDSSPLLSNGSLSKLSYNLRSLSMSTPSLIKPEKNSLDSAQDTSMNNAHVGDKSLQNVKSSLKMEEKAMDDDTGKEDIQKAIDLTNSDVSDDEISEVPCEIDLAESEEEKGHSDGEKSISSQTTVHKEADEDLGLRDLAVAKESKVSISSPLSLPNGKPLTNGTCESGNSDETKEDANRGVEDVKRAVEDENVEGSASKKAKLDDDNDDDAEFPSDEDSMLLSFVDVTRDEENEDN